MNNILLDQSKKWLTELGIRTIEQQTCLLVNRDDIDNLCGIGVVYQSFLEELKTALNTKKLFWSYKDDTWLYLSSF
jgi:hypothetical protein